MDGAATRAKGEARARRAAVPACRCAAAPKAVTGTFCQLLRAGGSPPRPADRHGLVGTAQDLEIGAVLRGFRSTFRGLDHPPWCPSAQYSVSQPG